MEVEWLGRGIELHERLESETMSGGNDSIHVRTYIYIYNVSWVEALECYSCTPVHGKDADGNIDSVDSTPQLYSGQRTAYG